MTMAISRDELAALYDDDRSYYQALVLHELFNDSRVSRRMAATLERMRAAQAHGAGRSHQQPQTRSTG